MPFQSTFRSSLLDSNNLFKYAFYLPIFFQSVQGVSTTQSGVQYIALVVPQIVSLVVTGGFVSTWGFYVCTANVTIYSLSNICLSVSVSSFRSEHRHRRRWPPHYHRPLDANSEMGCIHGHHRHWYRNGSTASVHSCSSGSRVSSLNDHSHLRIITHHTLRSSVDVPTGNGRYYFNPFPVVLSN